MSAHTPRPAHAHAPASPADQAHRLRLMGYLQTAPACGDCAHCQGVLPPLHCARFDVPVQDEARCAHWAPSPEWASANPGVAHLYERSLSLAEQAYLHRNHVL